MKELTINDYYQLVKDEMQICKDTCPDSICYGTKDEYLANFKGFYHGIFVCILHTFGFTFADKFYEDCKVLKKEYADFLESRVRRYGI